MGNRDYEEAVDQGYDGPSPFQEKRRNALIAQNNLLDCRDPDHDPDQCPSCRAADEEE